MNKRKTIPGINIQYPISQLIVDGTKTVETRTYPIPLKFVGKPMAIIETPGINGKFKARVIGVVIFKDCFKYESEIDFYKDKSRHCVDSDSIWAWSAKPKWGWIISEVTKFKNPIPAPKKKGIQFTKSVKIK